MLPATEVASQPQFVDREHGWLYISRSAGIGLYGTSDGGLSWTRLYTRSSGAFHFFDSTNGVILDSNGFVEVTEDGGRSWRLAGELPAFSGVSQAALAFFGDSHRGLALVWRPDDTAQILSTDDVVHWRRGDRIQLTRPFSMAANSQVALLVSGGAVRRSLDGGQTWQAVDFHYLVPESVAVEGDSLVVGDAATDDGLEWRPEFPPLSLGQFHHPSLFYATDGTPFVLDSFLLGKREDTRLFMAEAGSWRVLELP